MGSKAAGGSLPCSSIASSLSVSQWGPLRLASLQTAPPRLGDYLTGILSVLRTKDNKGMIWSDNGLLPLSPPLDFAVMLGVEHCL